jgi:hypothetical protein
VQDGFHSVERFLLDFDARLDFLMRGLYFDVVENALLPCCFCSKALHFAQFIIKHLGLQGLLTIGFGDVLSEYGWISLRFETQLVFKPLLRSILWNHDFGFNDLVELAQISVVGLSQGRVRDFLMSV